MACMETNFSTSRSLCEAAGRAAGTRWMDYQVKLQNTFLHVEEPTQGSQTVRASSAPASCRRSDPEEVAAGHGNKKPVEFEEMQTCSSQCTSPALPGASVMDSKDHEEDVHVGFNYEPPTNFEADVASFSSGFDDTSIQWGSLAERPSAFLPFGMASRESTPVKQLDLVEVHAGTPRSASTRWADDSDQSDSMTDGASFGTESKYVGDSLFADVDYAGPINSALDFETLRSVPKCNLSPSRFPARVPDGAAPSGMASNHGGSMFINTGYYFGSRTDMALQDPAGSRVMAPVRPVTSRFTSGHLSPPLGTAPVSSQTQPYSGKSAKPQADSTAEVLSSGWSVGTTLHSIGKCRPCTFAWKEGGCTQGTSCKFCHVFHAIKRTQRPCKGKRVHYRKLLERIAGQIDGGAYAQADPNGTPVRGN